MKLHAAERVDRPWKSRTARRQSRLAFWIAVCIAVLSATAFAVTAYIIATPADAKLLDSLAVAAIRARTSARLTLVLSVVSALHHPAFLFCLTVLAAGAMIAAHNDEWLATLVVAVPGGMLTNFAVKHVFARARPVIDQLAQLPSYSFPSGHTAAATLVYGLFTAVVLLSGARASAKLAAVAAATAMITTVAYSRVYLEMHYLTDVIGGAALAAAWLSACIALKLRAPGHKP